MKRNYGIDLCRLFLMFMVCILHTLGHGGVLDASSEMPTKSAIFWLMETFAFCAVDGFAFISGYASSGKNPKFNKLINMWFQVIFYSFFVTAIVFLLGLAPFNIKDLIKGMLPLTTNIYWYFSSYFILFFTIPLLNKFFESLDKNTSKKAFIIIIFLFTILEFLTDPFKIIGGYSGLWLMALYSLGILSKKIDLFKNKSSLKLILIWLILILISWALNQFLGLGILISYVSPTILFSGIIMVILFSRIKLNQKCISIISKLSPLAFGIYLFQETPIIRNTFIKNSFSFLANKNIILSILGVLLIAFIIFFIGLIIEFIRTKIYKLSKISTLSKKIESFFINIINLICKMKIF